MMVIIRKNNGKWNGTSSRSCPKMGLDISGVEILRSVSTMVKIKIKKIYINFKVYNARE
jgi:hypothetical protein